MLGFVTNPIFQKASVIELNLANKASKDLEAVIGVSNELKKVSERLRKVEKDKR
jgi:hypothetical protein